jgi:hypothetical protein
MCLWSRIFTLKFLLLTAGLNTLVVFEKKYVNVRAVALVDILSCNFSLWGSLLMFFAKFMFMPYYRAVPLSGNLFLHT